MGTHVTLTQRSFRCHLRLLTSSGQDMHNLTLYLHTLMAFHGTWTKECWGRDTHAAPATSWMQ